MLRCGALRKVPRVVLLIAKLHVCGTMRYTAAYCVMLRPAPRGDVRKATHPV